MNKVHFVVPPEKDEGERKEIWQEFIKGFKGEGFTVIFKAHLSVYYDETHFGAKKKALRGSVVRDYLYLVQLLK